MNRRRLMLTVPLGIAAGCGLGFYDILKRMGNDRYDPHALPSQLIGKRPPQFDLPGLNGGPGFTSADLAHPAKPMLVNFFASWCIPCTQEAAMLDKLAQSGMVIWGIVYEDKPAAAINYLKQYGNPYARIATDQSGLNAINWGVYGVPETYLIDRSGIVRWRWAGPLDDNIVSQDLDPLLREYA
jgi:cytochrome c biogenesis protein CcmG, thiol:disulfide interchange protein DsbE